MKDRHSDQDRDCDRDLDNGCGCGCGCGCGYIYCYSYTFTFMFVLGTNRGPTDRIQALNDMLADTIDLLHFLRKPPHAFGSESVKKSGYDYSHDQGGVHLLLQAVGA